MKSNRRYGYKDVWEVRDVIANYSAADIPLEAQWIDIDISTMMDCTLGVIKERVSEPFTEDSSSGLHVSFPQWTSGWTLRLTPFGSHSRRCRRDFQRGLGLKAMRFLRFFVRR